MTSLGPFLFSPGTASSVVASVTVVISNLYKKNVSKKKNTKRDLATAQDISLASLRPLPCPTLVYSCTAAMWWHRSNPLWLQLKVRFMQLSLWAIALHGIYESFFSKFKSRHRHRLQQLLVSLYSVIYWENWN